MSNLLNHDFNDSESDDEEFNPAPEVDSGDEKAEYHSADEKPSRSSRGPDRGSRVAVDDED